MKKYMYLFILFFIFILISGIISSCAAQSASNTTYTIAVAEANPGTEEEPNPHSLYAGVKMAADEVNREGGINGRQIKVVPYADNKDAEQAKLNAQDIVISESIAVVGHSVSETSIAAAPFYQEANLASINASPVSATTFDTFPNYFNISYTSEQQGAYLANYAKNSIGDSGILEAMVIYDEKDRSTSALAQKFRNTFKGLGGTILFSQHISADATDEELAQAAASIFEKNRGFLLIAANEKVSANLVIALKNRGFDQPILGGDNLSSRSFIEIIQSKPAEKARPGYYTDGIITTRALLPDSASGFTSQFVTDYQEEFPDIAISNSAARGYDAALAIIKSIQIAQTNEEVASDRQKIYDALVGLNDPKSTFYGVTGPIYFQNDRNAVRQILLGIYQYGHLISAPVQYEPILIPENIPNIKEQLAKGHIITLDGKYVYVTHVIYTGMDIIEIRELDQKASTYTADFYLWFRFKPQPGDKEFQPEKIVFTNAEGSPASDVVRDEETSDGSIYKTLRISGKFKSEFYFHGYPFDKQNLAIQFRNESATASFIQYVIDRPGMRYSNDAELLNHLKNNGTFRELYGWEALLTRASQKLFSTTSTLGDPQNFDNTITTNFSQFTINILVKRNSLEFVIKSLLPLLITLILAYITFFLPLGHSERLGVGSTALLTTAFFHLSLASSLPEIGYTVAIEYFFYSAYLMSALIVLLETISIRLETQASSAENQASDMEGQPATTKEKKLKKLNDLNKLLKLKERYERMRQTLNKFGRIVYPSILIIVLALGALAYKEKIDLNVVKETDRSAVQEVIDNQVVESTLPQEVKYGLPSDEVTLQLATWRPEDDAQIKSLLQAFHEKNPDITVIHQPISGHVYTKVLTLQFTSGLGPDLFFMYPFDKSHTSFTTDVSDLPIEENFNESRRIPWQDDAGRYYGLPYVGVIQGVYYNKDIFKRLNLAVPATWEEFLFVAETLKQNGYIPIGNSLKEEEEDDMFMSLIPNFIGGVEGRKAYMRTDGIARCFNDPFAVRAFQSVQDVAPYMNPIFYKLNSNTTKEDFINQRAAMLFGGSWDVNKFSTDIKGAKAFNWGVFASPAPLGSKTTVIFQPDIAIGINNNTAPANQKAAMRFLEWLLTEESLNLTNEILPGFYPLSNIPINPSTNMHSAEFQQLAINYPTDLRWAHSELKSTTQRPSAAELIQSSLYNVAVRGLDPQIAADRVQAGMAQWYEPAQTCKP